MCLRGYDHSFVLQELKKFKLELNNVGMPINWGGFLSKKIIGNIFQNKELLEEPPCPT